LILADERIIIRPRLVVGDDPGLRLARLHGVLAKEQRAASGLIDIIIELKKHRLRAFFCFLDGKAPPALILV
jgi:hypothetical protein